MLKIYRLDDMQYKCIFCIIFDLKLSRKCAKISPDFILFILHQTVLLCNFNVLWLLSNLLSYFYVDVFCYLVCYICGICFCILDILCTKHISMYYVLYEWTNRFNLIQFISREITKHGSSEQFYVKVWPLHHVSPWRAGLVWWHPGLQSGHSESHFHTRCHSPQ